MRTLPLLNRRTPIGRDGASNRDTLREIPAIFNDEARRIVNDRSSTFN